MVDIFISYSRKDKAFVQRLHAALTEQGRDTWVDWEDIPLSAEWLKEIYSAIEAADIFLFVISPDSAASVVCRQEVDHAVLHNKRLIPLLHRDPESNVVHDALRAHNYIYIRDTDDFDRVFESLLETLDTDLAFVKAHTRLLVRALEWDGKSRNTSYVLRGNDLQEAEGWLASSADKEPQPTDLQLQYIAASRQAANARQRVIIGALAVGFVIAIILTGIAINRSEIATENEQTAVAANATTHYESDQRATAQSVAVTQQNIAEQNAATAVEAEAVAQRNADVAQSQALAAGAQLAINENNPELAIALGLEANSIDDPPSEAQRTLADAAYGAGERRVWSAHEGGVTSVMYSPDGTLILSSGCARLDESTCVQGVMALWDATTGALKRTIGDFKGQVKKAVFNRDGTQILSTSCTEAAFRNPCPRSEVILWDVDSGTALQRYTDYPSPIYDVAISPDGQYVAAGGDDGVMVWKTDSGALLYQKPGTLLTVWSVAFSPDSTILATGDETFLRLLQTETGEDINKFLLDSIDGKSIAFSPDGVQVLVGTRGAEVELWDVFSRQLLRKFTGHENAVTSVAFSSDGLYAVSSGGDANGTNRSVIVWEVASGVVEARFDGASDASSGLLSGGVTSAAFSPDGQHVVSGSIDTTIRIWDLGSGAIIRRLEGHKTNVYDVAFSPDGRLIASGSIITDQASLQAILESGQIQSSDSIGIGEIVIWDAATGAKLLQLLGHEQEVNSLAFTRDSHYLISGGGDGLVMVWNAETGEMVQQMKGHDLEVLHVAVSPDERLAVSSDFDANVIVWDIEAGTEMRRYPEPIAYVNGLTFGADGLVYLTIIGTSGPTELVRWNAESGEVVQRLPLSIPIGNIAISRDGKRALVSSYSNSLSLIDLESGKIIGKPFLGHDAGENAEISITSVAFSPDGRYALSGGEDTTAILWDVASGEAIRRFRGHSDAVSSVAFSPDGRSAITGSWDNDVILWRIDSLPELITWTNANRVVREATCNERLQYRLATVCDTKNVFATRTPYPTLTPTPTFTPSPTIDFTRTTATPTATVTPTATSSPTTTATPSRTPTATPVGMELIPPNELSARVAALELSFTPIVPGSVPPELFIFRVREYESVDNAPVPDGSGFAIGFSTDPNFSLDNPQHYVLMIELPNTLKDIHEWAETTGAASLVVFHEVNGVETAVLALGRDQGVTAAIQDGVFVYFAGDGIDFDLFDQLIMATVGVSP